MSTAGELLTALLRSEQAARVFKFAVPVTTFVLGILAQHLLEEYLSAGTVGQLPLVVLTFVAGLLVIAVGVQTHTSATDLRLLASSVNQRADDLTALLGSLRDATGLTAEYVEDGATGESYARAVELISQAQSTITIVDYWEPFEDYQADDGGATDTTSAARGAFYAAIEEAVQRHKMGSHLFHRRVVQIPQQRLAQPIPFAVDPPFEEYLGRIATVQQEAPRCCRLRVAPAQIRFHFIMIDERFLILPILRTDEGKRQQTRLGALFFDDRLGELARTFRGMYQDLDAKSSVLDTSRITKRSVPSGEPVTDALT